MKRLFKITFYTAIGYILLCIIIASIINSQNLYFIHEHHETMFHQFIALGIPISILLFNTQLGFTKKPTRVKTISYFISTTFGAFFSFFFIVILTFDTCSNFLGEEIFIHRKNSNIKILYTSFGCGATDSTPDSESISKTHYYWGIFYTLEPIDTTKIDHSEWKKVNK